MNPFAPKMRSFFFGSLAVATVLGGCLAASDTGESKNTPEEVAKSETPEVDRTHDAPVPGAIDALDNPKRIEGPVKVKDISAPDGTKIKMSYQEKDGVNIAQGDIILPTEIMSATSLGRFWPGNTIAYVIDTGLPSSSRVTDAIKHWEEKTALRFVPRTKERDYIHFRSGGGCSSPIGQQGGRQFVNLNTGESTASVWTVGIDRSQSPERVTWFYKRGYATTGTLKSADQFSSHFRYIMPPGKSLAAVVDVAFDSKGHLFTFFDDNTVSEGTAEDLGAYALAKPFALPEGKTAKDVAGFAFDKTDKAFAFFKDGSVGTGTADDMSAAGEPLVLAEGKTAADIARVEYTGAGENPGFVVFYNELKDIPDAAAGEQYVAALPYAVGNAALGKTTFTGHCSAGATIHEIGHAMGLFHEQTRHDRDEHVEIIWDNIDPAARFNFEKHSKVVGTDTGAYDFDSIMHYGPTAFSANGEKTIVRRAGGEFREQREGLSPGDLVGIEAMYGKKK